MLSPNNQPYLYRVRSLLNIFGAQNNGLNVCHLNARSIRNKGYILQEIFEGSDVHALLVSETWLNEDINSRSVSLAGYSLFRCDRSGRRGGGVAIFIRDSLDAKFIACSNPGDTMEFLCVEISSTGHKCCLLAAYCPPNLFDEEVASTFQSTLADILARCSNVIVGGDFNVDVLCENTSSRYLLYFMQTLDLKVLNSLPTYFNTSNPSQLDLLLSADMDSVLFVNQLSPPDNFDHDFIYMSYNFPVHLVPQPTSFIYRDYKNVDYDGLSQECASMPWDYILNCLDVDDKVTRLTDCLTFLFNKYVPLRICKRNYSRCPWFTNGIRTMIAEKDLLYHRYKASRSDAAWTRYKTFRNRVNCAIRAAKRRYYFSRLNPELPPKTLWNNLRRLGVYGKEKTSCDFDADELNKYFTSRQDHPSDITHNLTDDGVINTGDLFSFRCVDLREVLAAIYSIKSVAAGPDEVSPRFIKIIIPFISHVLVNIFNTCLTTSQFPSLWKEAIVLPIPKKQKLCELADFRPISILCFFSKVLEKLMHAQMVTYLNSKNLLTQWQSGFRPGHSCESALLKVISDIGDAIDRDQMAILVLLDFSKAFDSINHGILLSKLKRSFGFSNTSNSLVNNFLHNRSQRVKVNDRLSSSVTLDRGIPQGSILGPLFFSLYINDLPMVLQNASIHLYADDVQIYIRSPIGLMEDCLFRLNEDLGKIFYWAKCNYLKLNPSKSKGIFIYNRKIDTTDLPPILINNVIVPYVDSVKNLGVQLNSSLSCCDHISSMIGRVYGCLRKLRMSASILSNNMRLKLANTLVLPHFIYGSLIFPKLDSQCQRKITVAFNDTIRFAYGLRRYSHVSPFIDSFLGCTLDTYLTRRRLVFLYNLIYTKEPRYLADRIQPLSSTRHRHLLLPTYRTRLGERSYFVQVIRKWNCLPTTLQKAGSAGTFARLLRTLTCIP